ncbi:MAG: hypothetical protein IPL47_07690 [Phyllobacteriaceae bacterium]|nr:hypothetical protein [Phyllobacteriaceae bacterium]
MKKLLMVAAVAASFAPVQAFAVTANIPFNGTVTSTCVITVGTPGTIMPNAGFTVLGSQQAGGAQGTATILTTDTAFDASVDAPSSWSSAPGGAPTTTFATEYDLSGATSASNVAGATTTALAAGTTSVGVDLTATASSGTYGAGTYTATAVLRCE